MVEGDRCVKEVQKKINGMQDRRFCNRCMWIVQLLQNRQSCHVDSQQIMQHLKDFEQLKHSPEPSMYEQRLNEDHQSELGFEHQK